MTDFPDTHRDLLSAKVASLATIDSRGIPQSTLIWFLFDDGELKVSLSSARLKTKHLMKRPVCSLLILDFSNPMRYLEVRGNVRIEADDDLAFAKRVGAKYDADLTSYDEPGDTRIVAVIEPVNVYPVDMSGG